MTIREVIFRTKYFIHKKSAYPFFESLLNSQSWSKAKIDDNGLKNFIRIYKYAFINSPYLRNKYIKAGLNIDFIKTESDILKVPTLTKQEVKDNFSSILTVSLNNKFLGKGATGGSTGTPMTFFTDRRLPVEAFAWRYLEWWGLKPWDDGAFIWRMPKRTKVETLMNRIAWWPIKKIRLDATVLSETQFNIFSKKLIRHKPKLIQGYVGAVYEYACYVLSKGIIIDFVEAVWVTSAPLADFQRKIIEDAFKAPVYIEYGSSEIPWIAAQCNEKEHLHINSEGRYLEIVNKDSNGLGDIIITDLLNKSFPLIRYELGDKSALVQTSCPCGIKLPLIAEVKGRKGDIITIPNVGKIDASFLTTIFDDFPQSIMSFQLIQHKNLNITLKVVPNRNYTFWQDEIDVVLKNLRKMVKNHVTIEVSLVEEIKSDRGKTRFIIREV